ncbi:hypothetical protein C0989_005811 [Termitomyces sp. Mn162]|nr:hypothetical protein C0989_005811 [Termitomyces sp. Mn162]
MKSEEAAFTTASISLPLNDNSDTLTRVSNQSGASATPRADTTANVASASSATVVVAEKSSADNNEETPVKNPDQEMYSPDLDPKLAKLATLLTDASSD